jgi:hypothetical protein
VHNIRENSFEFNGLFAGDGYGSRAKRTIQPPPLIQCRTRDLPSKTGRTCVVPVCVGHCKLGGDDSFSRPACGAIAHCALTSPSWKRPGSEIIEKDKGRAAGSRSK